MSSFAARCRVTAIIAALVAMASIALLPSQQVFARTSRISSVELHAQQGRAAQTSLTQYVNPYIGTADANPQNPEDAFGSDWGSTFPGADYPFGMVEWSPDTRDTSSNNALGVTYDYSQTQIRGFSLTHRSGVGCPLAGDIPIMPTTLAITSGSTTPPSNHYYYASTFSHSNERYAPGYYGVSFNNGVSVDLTVTPRTGFGKFAFPGSSGNSLLFNVPANYSQGVPDENYQVAINTTNDTVSGFSAGGYTCGRHNTYKVYFFAQFDTPFQAYGTWSGGTMSPSTTSSTGSQSGGYVTFNASAVQMQVGLSYVSVANAQDNVNREETGGYNFTTIQNAATATWNTWLNKVQVNDPNATGDDLTKFYTALYHTLLEPNVFSDANGQYLGFDNTVHTVESGRTFYSNFSTWDVYRSEIPLLAILAPAQTSDMIESLILDGQQSGRNALPLLPLENDDAYSASADPSPDIVANAYAFGATNFNTTAAEQLMMNAATNPSLTNAHGYYFRPGLAEYQSLGYLHDGQTPAEVASETMEYAQADFAIAQFASAIGKTADAETMLQQSQNWEYLYNPGTNYLEPRTQSGNWIPNYDHVNIGNNCCSEEFFAANSTLESLVVPYNPADLIQRLGGNSAVVSRLDTYFSSLQPGDLFDSPYYNGGNESGISIPWLYNWAGAPSHTQDVVRRIQMDQWFNTPAGLPGNDDFGEMSSWYVFASLGLYPIMPGVGDFTIGSPQFASVTLSLDNGHTVTITGQNASDTNHYVQSLSVNGSALNTPWLSAATVLNGATLAFVNTNTATSWGANSPPPSYRDYTMPIAGDVASLYNNKGISDDSAIGAANMTYGASYSAQALANPDTGYPALTPGATVISNGVTFTWPTVASGQNDNIAPTGQTVTFTTPRTGTKLGFLGSATSGPVSGTVTITYTDGSTATGTLTLGDWALGGGSQSVPSGDTIVTSSPYCNVNGGRVNAHAYVFSTFIAIDPTKAVKSVTLPNATGSGLFHIFDIETDGALAPALNNIGTSNDSQVGSGNLAVGYSYSAQALAAPNAGSPALVPGAHVSVAGTDVGFTWPSATAGQPDNVQAAGQVIRLPGKVGATTLGFLGSATFGPSSGTATITYTDGSTSSFTLTFGDWTLSGDQAPLPAGDEIVTTMPYHNGPSGQVTQHTYVFYTAATLDPSKILQSVTLPSSTTQGQLHVFAIATDDALAAAMNNVGTSDDSNVGAGNLAVGYSYSAEAFAFPLPGSPTLIPGATVLGPAGAVTFQWPAEAAGQVNNVQATGQVIRLPGKAGATTLGFLGSATFGPSSGTATITYTDGSTSTFTLTFGDWTLSGNQASLPGADRLLATAPYHNSPSGRVNQNTYVFYTSAPLDPTKTVQSVTLPSSVTQGQLHVFAVGVQ